MSGLGGKKHFSSADTVLTHPLFFLSLSRSCPAVLPVFFFVDLDQNSLPLSCKCQKGHSSEDEQHGFSEENVFTALQLVSAFTISSSAICVEKAITGKCPSLQAGSTEIVLTV